MKKKDDRDRERIRSRVLQGRKTVHAEKNEAGVARYPYNTRAALVKEKISRG
jgi:hypothetical protein